MYKKYKNEKKLNNLRQNYYRCIIKLLIRWKNEKCLKTNEGFWSFKSITETGKHN